MTNYIEQHAGQAPKQSLQHYADAQRSARRAVGERRAQRRSRVARPKLPSVPVRDASHVTV